MATAEETFVMVGKEPLWAAAQRCHEALSAAGISHAIVGGVAVCLHGYQRTTVDVDLLVAPGAGDPRAGGRGCVWHFAARSSSGHLST